MNQSRMKLTQAALVGAAILALYATSNLSHAADPMTSATGGNLPSADRKFVEKAAMGGMTEVKASELAKTNASSPAAKDFAAHMVTDHTKAGAQLTKIAADKGVAVPGTLDKSHQKDIDDLAKKNGADFDKAYMKMMVSDHKTTVSDFEKEAKSGKDSDIKMFAATTLPTLQEHMKSAQAANDQIKK